MAIILRCDDDTYRVLDVNLLGRIFITLEEWFKMHSGCMIAWRKLYCCEQDGPCVQIRGFAGSQCLKILQDVDTLDKDYPSLMQVLLRRSRLVVGPQLEARQRMNCIETVTTILKHSQILPENLDTTRWIPDNFRCNILDKHLTPSATYFREQIINTKSNETETSQT